MRVVEFEQKKMNRRECLLGGVELASQKGIEVGPLTCPLISKDESNVKYVDRCSKIELVKHYSQQGGVNIDNIINIDEVWGDCKLKDCLGDFVGLDYVVASHVIEHVPDFLGWLHEIADVLREGGRLGLVIPDKRFTFDYLRQPTRLSEIIDAYLRGNKRPSPAQIFDNHVNVAEINVQEAWRGSINPLTLKRYANPEFALVQSIESVKNEVYIDVHCWVFTPKTLLELFIELSNLKLMPFRCQKFFDTEENDLEMAIVLEKIMADEMHSGKEGIISSYKAYISKTTER